MKMIDLRLPYAELRSLNNMERKNRLSGSCTMSAVRICVNATIRRVTKSFVFVGLWVRQCCRDPRQALTHKRACGEIGLLTLRLSCAFMEITLGDMTTQGEKRKE